jgi:hypothetical protein
MRIVALNLRRMDKNTLRAFVDIELSDLGIIIKDCCWHEKCGKQWVSPPGRQFQDKTSGTSKWTNTVEFASPAARAEFQQAALLAIHREAQGTEGALMERADAALFT